MSVIESLQYIADSPPHSAGGFHPETVRIAKDAIAEINRLNLLLVRKNEALAVFAAQDAWTGCYVWNGINDMRNPMAFAKRESEADEPCETEYPTR